MAKEEFDAHGWNKDGTRLQLDLPISNWDMIIKALRTHAKSLLVEVSDKIEIFADPKHELENIFIEADEMEKGLRDAGAYGELSRSLLHRRQLPLKGETMPSAMRAGRNHEDEGEDPNGS